MGNQDYLTSPEIQTWGGTTMKYSRSDWGRGHFSNDSKIHSVVSGKKTIGALLKLLKEGSFFHLTGFPAFIGGDELEMPASGMCVL